MRTLSDILKLKYEIGFLDMILGFDIRILYSNFIFEFYIRILYSNFISYIRYLNLISDFTNLLSQSYKAIYLFADELRSVDNDTAVAVRGDLSEGRLDPHADINLVDIRTDNRRRQARTLVKLDDCDNERRLKIELVARCPNDRERNNLARALELIVDNLSLASALGAERPRREIISAACLAFRTYQIISVSLFSPESWNRHL